MMTIQDYHSYVMSLAHEAKEAQKALGMSSHEVRQLALRHAALLIRDMSSEILQANQIDVEAGTKNGLSAAMIDRLTLDESRLEAMAVGKPVIASKTGGIPEIVEHNKTGLLVPPGNIPQLAQAMIQLRQDKDLCQKFSQAGMDNVNAKFSLEAMVQNIEKVYDALF